MPILYYSTSIKVEKTIMEITKCLVDHGATKIVTDYENGVPIALTFCLNINDLPVAFALPVNYEGVLRVMKRDGVLPRRMLTEEQAFKVSWRQIKGWVEAQMSFVESGQVDMAQVFLPYAITNNGKTLYEEIKTSGMKFLQEKN